MAETPDRPRTGRSVDDLPTPDKNGVRWNWAMEKNCFRGWCLVQPFIVEVRLYARDPIHPFAAHDYDLVYLASFLGYDLYRQKFRMPVELPQVTPEAILDVVEELDLVHESVNAARSLIETAVEMTGTSPYGDDMEGQA